MKKVWSKCKANSDCSDNLMINSGFGWMSEGVVKMLWPMNDSRSQKSSGRTGLLLCLFFKMFGFCIRETLELRKSVSEWQEKIGLN